MSAINTTSMTAIIVRMRIVSVVMGVMDAMGVMGVTGVMGVMERMGAREIKDAVVGLALKGPPDRQVNKGQLVRWVRKAIGAKWGQLDRKVKWVQQAKWVQQVKWVQQAKWGQPAKKVIQA
jgi:hypothetical protein